MNSRMEKYDYDSSELKKRTEKNADLYLSEEIDDYNKIDLNSNVSVLKTDVRNIDVDKVREILDRKYRDNIPRRKSIAIDPEEEDIKEEDEETKDYDINEILAKAKTEQTVDYQKERLKKLHQTSYDILENIIKEHEQKDKNGSEEELMNLINTITHLEIQNQKAAKEAAEDLLDFSDEEDDTNEFDTTDATIENSFYTGNLMVTDKDFEDFEEIQKDIKSNSVIIKILVFIFIIAILAAAVYFLNKYFNWGLF